MGAGLKTVWEIIIVSASDFISNFRIVDIIDITIVAFIVYYALKLIKETRAMQFLRGIIFLAVLTLLSSSLEMYALNFLLQSLMAQAVFIIIILFQPELRNAIAKFGRGGRLKNFDIFSTETSVSEHEIRTIISELCEAADSMSKSRVGALMVIERDTKLGDIIGTGTVVDAALSALVIENIFFKDAPLHDGAMIIRNGRIYAAGCVLPLTQNSNISKALGTRHRAAIGMSEESDAFIIIVSEESGMISVAESGNLRRPVTKAVLGEMLENLLITHRKQKNFKHENKDVEVKDEKNN